MREEGLRLDNKVPSLKWERDDQLRTMRFPCENVGVIICSLKYDAYAFSLYSCIIVTYDELHSHLILTLCCMIVHNLLAREITRISITEDVRQASRISYPLQTHKYINLERQLFNPKTVTFSTCWSCRRS